MQFGGYYTVRHEYTYVTKRVRSALVSGQSWCLDAFNVALAEAYSGRGTYMPTKNLKLASLQCCLACRSVSTLNWPASLQQLTFGEHFNQPILAVVSLSSMQQRTFVWNFSRSIRGEGWPVALQELNFGVFFN